MGKGLVLIMRVSTPRDLEVLRLHIEKLEKIVYRTLKHKASKIS